MLMCQYVNMQLIGAMNCILHLRSCIIVLCIDGNQTLTY